MYKRMSMLPLVFLLFAAFVQPVSAEEPVDPVKKKFDELVEAGIFEGWQDNTQNNSTMTREQLAVILARLKKLDQVNPSSYTDVDGSRWSAGFIEAVTKAGLMNGIDDDLFDPASDVTLEQLATVMVRALNLSTYSDQTVEGEVSDWAKSYVAAALESDLIGKSNDYTVPATHEWLVNTAYNTNQKIVEQQGFGITVASQIGAKRVEIKLNAAPDPSSLAISIVRVRDRTSVDIESLEWSETGHQVVAQLAEPLTDGSYEVKISGSDAIDPTRTSHEFTAEAERMSKLKWGGPDTLPYDDNVEVPFFVLNQFDEPMDAKDAKFSFSALNASIERIPDRAAVLVHLLAKAKPGDSIDLIITHASPKMSATKTYRVGEGRVVSAIEIDGVPAEPLESGQSAELIIRVYDQYGVLIKDPDWLNGEQGVYAESENPRLATVSALTTDAAGNIVVRVAAGQDIPADTTVNIAVNARSGSAGAQATLAVKAAKAVSTVPVVSNPPANPTVIGNVYTVGSNFAYVTVDTDDATQVYYYYEKKDASPDVPTADEVRTKAFADPQGGSAPVSSNQASFVLLDLAFGHDYELFVVAADSSGQLSDVQTYEFSSGYLDSFVEWFEDEENPTTGRCVFVYDAVGQPNPEAYYLLTGQPIHGVTADAIKEPVGTRVDSGMFTFQLKDQVLYLYVAYENNGKLELFAYASDNFPV